MIGVTPVDIASNGGSGLFCWSCREKQLVELCSTEADFVSSVSLFKSVSS